MAAPKKTTTKAPAKKAPAKKAPAKQADPVQEAVSTLKGFQLYTLIGIGLLVAFVVFQLFDDLRFIWWLNIPAAVGSAVFFWHQTKQTKGLEHMICKYGLIAIIALFVIRDIYLAERILNPTFDDIFSMNQ